MSPSHSHKAIPIGSTWRRHVGGTDSGFGRRHRYDRGHASFPERFHRLLDKEVVLQQQGLGARGHVLEHEVWERAYVVHELMIERMPLKMDGPGRPNEDAAQGMIEDMDPGASGKMMLKLKPGNYVLFCNVPGHYAAGQHVRFTVTGS